MQLSVCQSINLRTHMVTENRTSLLYVYHYSQVLVYKDSKCQIICSFALSITTTRAIAIFAFGLRIILASKQINSRFVFDKTIHHSCMQLCREPTIQHDFRYKYPNLLLFYFYQNKIYHGEQEILVHQPIHHVLLQIATALLTHDSIALLAEENRHSPTLCQCKPAN